MKFPESGPRHRADGHCALTIAAGIAYCQIKAVAMTWYIVAALIVGGFMVAYAAMFGYDKLMEIMQWGGKRE